jgi:hypothetical protein
VTDEVTVVDGKFTAAGLDEGILSFSLPILVYMDNPYRYNEYQ